MRATRSSSVAGTALLELAGAIATERRGATSSKSPSRRRRRRRRPDSRLSEGAWASQRRILSYSRRKVTRFRAECSLRPPVSAPALAPNRTACIVGNEFWQGMVVHRRKARLDTTRGGGTAGHGGQHAGQPASRGGARWSGYRGAKLQRTTVKRVRIAYSSKKPAFVDCGLPQKRILSRDEPRLTQEGA